MADRYFLVRFKFAHEFATSFATWFVLSIMAILCLTGCTDKSDESKKNLDSTELEYCMDPPATLVEIKLLPLGDISGKKMELLKETLQKGLETLESGIEDQTYMPLVFDIKILPEEQLPDSCYYEPRARYRAEKLLRFIKQKYGRGNDYVIAVTNKDISTSIHGSVDYGIQGLSYRPGNVSVISTFRVKDKKNLWKLAAHEFCHGFFKLPHCAAKNPHCLMKDAEGGDPRFELKELLCDSCISSIWANL